jgi:RNA polymerase sigma factor (sigma-70 family)
MPHDQEEGEDRPVPLTPRRDNGAPPRATAADHATRTPQFERLITEVIVSGGPALLRLAASICPQDAEDIFNVATERALARPEAFAHGEPGKLYRWLERVVRNEALKTLRARRRELPTDPEALAKAPDESAGADPHAALAATQEHIATLEALAELHPVQASCLALSARGYSRADIAEVLGVTPLTVKRRLEQGRAALGRFGDDLESGRRCARLRPGLSDYVDRLLEGQELRRLQRHLDHCGRCRGHVVALRRQRSRIAAALPSALLLSVAEMAVSGGDRDLQVSRQLAEAAHDGWLALSGSFLSRVVEGWHALSPLAKLAGTGAAALLALAGVGTFSGGDRAPADAPGLAASRSVASRPAPPVETPRATRPRRRPSPPPRARPAADPAPREGTPAAAAPKARASSPAPDARAPAASSSSAAEPPSLPSPPAPAGPSSAVDLARAEFEPGPP